MGGHRPAHHQGHTGSPGPIRRQPRLRKVEGYSQPSGKSELQAATSASRSVFLLPFCKTPVITDGQFLDKLPHWDSVPEKRHGASDGFTRFWRELCGLRDPAS